MSSVVSNTPNAPAPLACGWRSGTFSRLKCAICSRKCTSCSMIGPLEPIVRELRSLGAGAPVPVVEPVVGLLFESRMQKSPIAWKSGKDRHAALTCLNAHQDTRKCRPSLLDYAMHTTDALF